MGGRLGRKGTNPSEGARELCALSFDKPTKVRPEKRAHTREWRDTSEAKPFQDGELTSSSRTRWERTALLMLDELQQEIEIVQRIPIGSRCHSNPSFWRGVAKMTHRFKKEEEEADQRFSNYLVEKSEKAMSFR